MVGGMTLFDADGQGTDRLIELTEGVIVDEARGPRLAVGPATVVESRAGRGPRCRPTARPAPRGSRSGRRGRERVEIELEPATAPFRLGAVWAARRRRAPDRARGATRRAASTRRGRLVRLGADRALHGPRLPARDARRGRHRAGRLRAGAVALLERRLGALGRDLGRRARARPRATGSRSPSAAPRGRCACGCSAIRHRRRACATTCGSPGCRRCCPSGRTATGRAATSTRTSATWSTTSRATAQRLPLDAIVIDSPWETQYNTWRFNPHQFPDPRGMIERMRAAGVRTVVWVTPWVNLDSADGQRPPDPESERLHRRPASNYAEGIWAGHYVRGRNGGPHVGRWWMGIGSPVDFSSPAARRWWQKQARRVLELGVEGIKADDGEGYYIPPEARFADRRTRRRGGLGLRRSLPAHDAGGARSGPPRDRGAVRPLRLERPAGDRDDLGRRPGLGLLVAAGPGRGDPDRGGERVLELVARRRRLPRQAPGRALPARAAACAGCSSAASPR